MIALTITSKATADEKISLNEFIKELTNTTSLQLLSIKALRNTHLERSQKILELFVKEARIIGKRLSSYKLHWNTANHYLDRLEEQVIFLHLQDFNFLENIPGQKQVAPLHYMHYHRELAVAGKLHLCIISENDEKVNKNWILNSSGRR